MRSGHKKWSTNQGFTLIELLTVMAILILLLALLVPRLSKMQEEARRSQCRSNLRQLGTAMLLYAGDNRGWLPARDENHVPPVPGYRDGEYEFDERPGFTYHVLKLYETGYQTDPGLWKCPSDRWNGDGNDIPVTAARSFQSPPFNSWENVSYMYVAGYNVVSTRENHSRAPVLADESNSRENGNLTPGAMPPLGEKAAPGPNFRNVLYLDGSVVALEDAESANSVFEGMIEPAKIQSVD